MSFSKFMSECRLMWPVTAAYGFLKGLVACIPCTLGFVVGCTGVTLWHAPMSLFRMVKAIVCTKKLGPTIKTLILLLSPLALALGIPLALIGAIFFSFCYSLFWPLIATFAADTNFFVSGLGTVFRNCFWRYASNYWKAMGEDVSGGLREFEDAQLKEGEEPFDVPIWWLLIGGFYAIFGLLVDGLAGLTLGIAHVIQGTFKVLYEILKAYFAMKDLWLQFVLLLPLVVVIVLTIVAAPITAFLVLPLGCGIVGMTAAAAAYKRGFRAGFRRVASVIAEADEFLCKLIYNSGSCLSFLKSEDDKDHVC